jgi:hypothetical protein
MRYARARVHRYTYCYVQWIDVGKNHEEDEGGGGGKCKRRHEEEATEEEAEAEGDD